MPEKPGVSEEPPPCLVGTFRNFSSSTVKYLNCHSKTAHTKAAGMLWEGEEELMIAAYYLVAFS